MAVVTTRQLLESGVHFGHQTRRWNPKMKRFIFTERNGIYIIDLQQSLTYIDRAYAFVKDTVARGGQVLFVGTKKQAQEAIAEQATRVGMPYVNQRWLGGMLTNFHTVIKRIQRLKELEGLDFDDIAASGLTKKELLGLRREKEKLERTLGGIRDMTRPPQAVWIVDTKKEHLAVDEARKLIPSMAAKSSTVLELAATIHWLSKVEHVPDWKRELVRRKGAKTERGRVEQALELLSQLQLSPA